MGSYSSTFRISAASLVWLMASTGFAQSPKAPPAPPAVKAPAATKALTGAEAAADLTSATFADWELLCRGAPVGDPAKPGLRSCEIMQSVFIQGQTLPFAQLAFGRVDGRGPLLFTIVVPNDVALATPMRLSVEEGDKLPVDLPWVRCRPNGCFATAIINDGILQRLQGRNEPGRISFVTGAGQNFVMPISFRGLSRALDGLAREKN